MDYSIIIRTKNSEKTIKNCLEAVKLQSIQPKEINIVDSGSTDSTLEIAQSFNVVIYHYPKGEIFNYSKALNIGISQTNSEMILILSSHVEIYFEHTVRAMFDLLKSNIRTKAVSIARTDSKINYSLNDLRKKIISLNNFRGRAMYNYCSLIYRDSWEEYPFNENIPRCEDQDWAFHFLKKGNTTGVVLNPKVFYKNPYYNFNKEILEYITMGKTVYPYYISNAFLKKNLKNCFYNLIKGDLINSKKSLILFINIFLYKHFGIYNNRSQYNKDL